MTREKLIRLTTRILTRRQGQSPDVQAEAIADAIEVAMEDEEPTSKPGCSDVGGPMPQIDPHRYDPERAEALNARVAGRVLPPSPAVTEAPDKPMIVLPGSPEACEVLTGAKVAAPMPRSLRRVSAAAQPDGEERDWWRIEDLSAALHANTPETIVIDVDHPERGPVRVKLVRNVVVGVGFDACKLIYKHPAVDDSLAVSETFWTTQKELPITEALEKIKVNAEKLYAPRPREITSSRPVRAGELRFDAATPHEETDRTLRERDL